MGQPYTREGHPNYGATASRPAHAQIGFLFFDTTLGQLLVKTGDPGTSTWAAADGSQEPINASIAAGGSVQGNATNVAGFGFTSVTAADGTKGVKLPVAVAGRKVTLKNSANAVLKVYPNTSGTINGGGANNSVDQTNLTMRTYVAGNTTAWFVDP